MSDRLRRLTGLAIAGVLMAGMTGCQYYPPTMRHEERDIELMDQDFPAKVHLSGDFSDAEPRFEEVKLTQPSQGALGAAALLDESAVYNATLTFTYDEETLKKLEIPEEQLILIFTSRDCKTSYMLKDVERNMDDNTLKANVWELGHYQFADERYFQNPTAETN
ncbi:MAG: hypothetical protein J5851_02190 [Oscillospiraceae bacterium]|nr:hypothetical protein [Oscillospiraceae bacterium]